MYTSFLSFFFALFLYVSLPFSTDIAIFRYNHSASNCTESKVSLCFNSLYDVYILHWDLKEDEKEKEKPTTYFTVSNDLAYEYLLFSVVINKTTNNHIPKICFCQFVGSFYCASVERTSIDC